MQSHSVYAGLIVQMVMALQAACHAHDSCDSNVSQEESDPEMAEMAKEEVVEHFNTLARLSQELRLLLLPKVRTLFIVGGLCAVEERRDWTHSMGKTC